MQIYNQQVAEQYTNFSKNSISRYQNFRRDRYIEKSVSLGATITKTNLPSLKEKLKQKATTISNTNNIRKEIGQAQRSESSVARPRKVLLRDVLTYHTVQSQIFDGDMTAKPDKSSLMKTLESSLIEDDYKVDKKIKACIIIDFMSSIRKIPFSKLSTFSDIFESMWKSMTSVSKFDTIHMVYDSYIGDSIKEAKCIRRAK